MKIKDKILSETSVEVKQRVRDTANKLVIKQETLEEVAEKYIKELDVQHYISQEDFVLGAKWQQEQIGKSEVLQKIRASKSDAEARRIIRTI